MAEFEAERVKTATELCRGVFASNVPPNHYHMLVQSLALRRLLKVF